jgi:hypothetical protein
MLIAAVLYLGEIFPTHIRAKGVAIALCSLNVTAAWLTMVFPVGLAAAGWKFLLLNICLMAVCAVLQQIYLKESRGVPLEEMARIWGICFPGFIRTSSPICRSRRRSRCDVEGYQHPDGRSFRDEGGLMWRPASARRVLTTMNTACIA